MLHLNSKGQCAPLASTSTHATSESCDSGPHDKRPVLIQACRMSSVPLGRCFTLIAYASLHNSSGTWLAAQVGNPRAVSPCASVRDRYQEQVGQQGALAHLYSSTNDLKCQASAPAGGGNSSPWLEARGLLATPVEVERSRDMMAYDNRQWRRVLEPGKEENATTEPEKEG